MPSPGTGDNTDSTLSELMQLVRELVAEVQPHRQGDSAADISLDTSFEKDLGLDSLTRVELVSRVEKKFSLALPEQVLAQVDSPRDLLRAIQGAVSSKQTPDGPVVQKGVQTVVQEAALDRVSQLPDEAETLLDVLDWHAARHPERPHIRLYADDVDGEIISYAQLRSGAAGVAAGLQQRGLQPAEPVVLMLPSGPEYFYSFFGILMAGGIPVPIYPPARPSQLEDHMRRHVRILRNCRASIFITVDEARKVARLLMAQVPELRHIVSLNELSDATAEANLPRISANDIAFIQYTSGSTGNPKGVMLTHANLLSNIRAMGRVIGADSSDVFVSWLPLYHDMGLIGAWLGSLYHAALFVVMSPLSFLARPERWLRAMHRYRGTLSASPNFGYEYCLRRIDDEDIKGIDLSSWRAAFNGAEPVSVETLEGFSSRFQAYGFSRKAMTPVYGLAESTVGLAFPPPGRGPLIDTIERDRFMRTGSARPV
ncbi:MAG TPA: acyl-phosphate glycerol 3-phosphate acyltransferase, partial [Gammaproteobacteria bacterium]|nr:acyl-phosphate glycerol 3-phosphate acyltransferase [Gammaproteobacteria bacterium]